MNRSGLIEKLRQRLGDFAQDVMEMKNNDIMLLIKKDYVLQIMGILKKDPDFRFTVLMNQLGTHEDERFSVIYNLYSFEAKQKLTVKAYIEDSNPEIGSVETVFKGINWFERETYDLLGIRFIGHSNLKRLLLPEDWIGHPLRKDYAYPDEYSGIDNSDKRVCESSGDKETNE